MFGQVLLPDDRPAAHAVVTLRDTTGRLQMRQRTVTADDAGRFVFPGLPEHQLLRLSATLRQSARDLISQQLWVQPGETEWILGLEAEDPALPGRRQR